MSDLWNRCDICGRFIGFDDFASGLAKRLFYLDPFDGEERYETICKNCVANEETECSLCADSK